ncbi:MAG: hypothetical protein ABJB66_17795 [Gemmatimonadaceae bacterium]
MMSRQIASSFSRPLLTIVFRISFAAAVATTLSACFINHGASTTLVSSERSDYSPVVTFRARVRVTDSVRVHVDQAKVLSPGDVFEEMGAIARRLSIQALLVTSSADAIGAGSANANGAPRSWTERASSAAIPLADSLVMGKPQTVSNLNFVLPMPADVDANNSWLVFRVTGSTVSAAIRMADGGVIPARVDENGIRVFACAMQNLNGKTDKVRAGQLRKAYNEVC